MSPSVSRREWIRLAASCVAGVVLAGCSRSDGDSIGPGGSTSGTETSAAEVSGSEDAAEETDDVALAHDALAGEAGLLELCRLAIRVHPQLRKELGPVAAIAARHVQALLAATDETDKAPTPSIEAPPRSLLAVRATVQQRIRAEQRNRAAECLAAQSGALARLLGSMSASHAMSASALAAARRQA